MQYHTGGKAYHACDSLRLHDPWLVLKYGVKRGITDQTGWEWVSTYLDAEDELGQVIQAYEATRGKKSGVPKYKFGLEVPDNPKRALEIDQEKGTKGWAKAMEKEINSLLEFDVFAVEDASTPAPEGYKRIPYRMVLDVKVDLCLLYTSDAADD